MKKKKRDKKKKKKQEKEKDIPQRHKYRDIRRVGYLLATATCKTNRQDFSAAACWVETPFKVKSASGED